MSFLTNCLYRNLIAFIILPAIISFPCSGQNVNTQYQVFTVNEGLPQNYLLGLAQDSIGFIWIGTKDGLARYDGHSFKTYRRGKDILHTPAANNVSNLYTDHHGYLWIQYDNRAIDRYDPSTGIFDHISNQPAWEVIRSKLINYELILDRHDNLWVITEKGVYRYDTRSRQLSPFTHLPGIIPLGIMEDHSGKIWMVTQKGFYIYDYSKDQLKNIPYQLSARQTYSGRNHKLGVGETESGKVIVTSLDSTVLIYDPADNSFQTITLRIKKRLVYDSGLGNTNLIASNNGDRWFTCNGRIFRIDKKTDDISEIGNPTTPQPDASALMIDRSGTLWFGKNAQGLCKINLKASRFVSKKYEYANFETNIMVNELGVRASDLPDGFDNPAFAYMFRNVIDTINKLIWIQNYLMSYNVPKLMTYDIGSGKLITKNISLSPFREIGISNDDAGNIWSVGAKDWNLFKINYHEGKIDKQLIDISSLLPDSLFKAGKIAINPVMDKNIMWIVTSNASIDFGTWNLVSIHLLSKQVHFYPVIPDNAEPSSSLLMMVNDPANQKYLWIGTTGNGLIRFDKTTGQSHAFTTDDGLPNNTIYAIVADAQNNLWLSSNKGITRFNPVTHAIRNFDIMDGLISNEFNRWHCFKLPDDRIAFGGITGYTIFRPANIKDDDFQPRVLLSNVLINNKPLPDSSSLTGGSSPGALNKLVLHYDQNFLGFEFASDEYNSPQKIRYRYRLTNFDNDWVYALNDRFASYTKLPPGKYILEINASNTSGIWSNKTRMLQIIIQPPWWQTWWAYSIYILIAVGLVVLFLYYRIRRIRLAQEMILQQKQTEQLKTIDEMKSRFFSNITHEFRTPLSLIISPVEKLQSETKDEQVHKALSTIQGNAKQLLHLINQLLDLSKLEAGNMSLHFSRGRLDEFVAEMVSLFLPLAEQQQIELTCQCDLSQEYLFDADKLKTLLFNLLSNAVKFTPVGGKIVVSATEGEDKKINISVSDTGIGISADKLPFIFDRFFQADDSPIRLYEGTGIGLALVKELAELMHGTVSAKSRQNTGTTIDLVFPAEKAGASNVPLWQKETMKDIAPVSSKKTIRTNGQEKNTERKSLPLLLLAEDNEELLAFLHESFERNFRVITANNGVSAFQLAKEEMPDLVISDVMMPEMDGYTLCNQLKTDTITGHIAVILLTAKTSYESRISGLQLGADDYISKPFHFDELETRIRNLLDHQEKQRANYRAQLEQKDAVVQMNETENPFLKKIYAIIEDMIDDPQLGASKLAEKNAMSLRTLNRKLNAIIGLTSGDLIRQYRLQKSLVFLKAGHNVSEAAYMVGFETPAYFSQCFKEQYGVSPKDYFADVH